MKIALLIIALPMLSLTAAEQPATTPLSQADIARTLRRIDRHEGIETDTLLRALISDQTYLRAGAARLLGDTADFSVVPALITALSDESYHVGANYPEAGMATTRYWANESLKKLTRQDFGFRWDAPKPDREDAISKWKAWAAVQSTSR